jgi:hypothetical protein
MIFDHPLSKELILAYHYVVVDLHKHFSSYLTRDHEFSSSNIWLTTSCPLVISSCLQNTFKNIKGTHNEFSQAGFGDVRHLLATNYVPRLF